MRTHEACGQPPPAEHMDAPAQDELPQGVAAEDLPIEIPPIADINFVVFPEPQTGQGTFFSRSPVTNSSKTFSQSLQRYSNMGISHSKNLIPMSEVSVPEIPGYGTILPENNLSRFSGSKYSYSGRENLYCQCGNPSFANTDFHHNIYQ